MSQSDMIEASAIRRGDALVTQEASADRTRRDFLTLVTGAFVAVGTGAITWPFIDSANPARDVLALSSTEADLAPGALPPTYALVRPESSARFRALLHLGLTDALRALHPAETLYTYWDYGAAFEINRGLRIDHVLLSPDLAERLDTCEVDTAPRSEMQPSDHTPVIATLR